MITLHIDLKSLRGSRVLELGYEWGGKTKSVCVWGGAGQRTGILNKNPCFEAILENFHQNWGSLAVATLFQTPLRLTIILVTSA